MNVIFFLAVHVELLFSLTIIIWFKKTWMRVREEKPDVVILHRSSCFIDYLMVNKMRGDSKIILILMTPLFHSSLKGRIECILILKV